MTPRKFPPPYRQTLAVLALALVALPVIAAPAVKILGFDDMSCQAWKQSQHDPDQRAQYVVWMRGLLTGHNYARPGQQVSAISSGTIEQFVTRYCNEHSQEGFDDAIFRLSDQYSGRNAPVTK